ncbi:hypothetical protein [Flavobacterium restrictum]|uniref:Outer membrane protein beta-barrel domain-containing protein n=1 Tax=Flavobacterium restrictum TaxID=2594428 RepID=A0A553DWL4_9FLAO|nr:hypothetical protein [Flavobacterium restrictum]TRX37070.1 hypothetical protein FNW21_12820 [Flavobacterium restrictum]
MKNNKLIILLLLVVSSVFSQEKIDSTKTKIPTPKWALEIGTGNSQGTAPYTDGYFATKNDKVFGDVKLNSISIGARYNYSKLIGFKMDLAFDLYKNNKDSRSKPFEVAQYRTSLQGIINLNTLFKTKNEQPRFTVLLHGGLNVSHFQNVKTVARPKVGGADYFGGFVIGLTPMFRVTNKTSVYFDISSYTNYRQHLAWDGNHSEVSNNLNGHMVSMNLGVSFAIGKK